MVEIPMNDALRLFEEREKIQFSLDSKQKNQYKKVLKMATSLSIEIGILGSITNRPESRLEQKKIMEAIKLVDNCIDKLKEPPLV